MKKQARIKQLIVCLLASCLIISILLTGCGSVNDGKAKQVEWPQKEKVVKVIVPYGTGGGADQVGRILSGVLEKKGIGKFVVENKVGGTGSIGLMDVMKSNPDGYTLGILPSNISIFKVAGVAPITYKDFKPVIAVNYDACALIVRADSEWKNFDDFKKTASNKELNIATGSAGGIWHLGAIKLQQATGLKFNMIPMTTGGAPAATTLMGKHVDGIIVAPNEAASQIKSGEFKILGIMAPERSQNFKDVPTFKELGYDVDIRSLRGIAVPKDTPDAIVKKIHDAFKEAANDQQYLDYMKTSLSNATYMNSEEYAKYCEKELEQYTKLMKDAGLAKN
ncbi:hypothetical protein BR63_13260 [Thermanaerosceptrum fracticalcis]|uniref:Tripartite tricarboxylate transporter substrate binding protein n=1 Tax=Thermanaerosceptrum fracticalcis TaxID=1712410 RepID=A0A7G6E530_THEFR|nr:tripartite tricarboxylate transporter substrate binding protein [Thermanaerosceptrum fracticalcis]QNB47184.1 hypothetical protein BR63_13260 [Thermanaerosceptrum fracticalcis]